MTTIAVSAGEIGVWEQLLVAATQDTINFGKDCDEIRVTNVNGPAALYFTVDGSNVTTGGQGTYWVPAVAGASRTVNVPTSGNTVVKVKSDGAPKYSVEPGGGSFAPLSAFTPAGEAHIGQTGGELTVVSSEFARPADTNAYAALDAIADSTTAPTLLTFTNLARANGLGGYIAKARIMTDDTAIAAPPRVRLHLFHTAPTPINDNAAFTLLWANRANRIGHIDFAALTTEGAGSTAKNAKLIPDAVSLPLAFKCAAASRTIYGMLETLDAFTPASAKSWFVELSADVN